MEKCILRKFVIQLKDNSFVGDFDFTCSVIDLCDAEMMEDEDVGRFMARISYRNKERVKEIKEVQIEYKFV